jgi:platelet-activating factor acetylhydrolase IB subunit beta/gamma
MQMGLIRAFLWAAAVLISSAAARADPPVPPCLPGTTELFTFPAPPPNDSSYLKFKLEAKEAAGKHPDVVVIGDSIAGGWPMESFAALGFHEPLNLGNGGDRVQNVEWRLSKLDLDLSGAKAIILVVGTNDMRAMSPICGIESGLTAILVDLRRRAPRARILVFGVLPRGVDFSFRQADRLDLNAATSKFSDQQGYSYVEMDNAITGTPNALGGDFLHPTAIGYDLMMNKIKHILDAGG